MYTLVQSKRAMGDAGEPLPTVFQALEDHDTRFIRGQLALVAAGPGTGKSAFILTQALRARIPTMYFSADTDSFTQLARAISIAKGWPLSQSAEMLLSGDISSVEKELGSYPIRLNYDVAPTPERLEEGLASYFEVYEDFPHLIVVDNLANVESSDDPESSGRADDGLMIYLNGMARWTQACVVGLHHVTGPYNDGNKPIPLTGVKGQLGALPAMVLTLHKRKNEYNDTEILCVSTVKNRNGKADASGEWWAELEMIGHTMTIRDIPPGQQIDMVPGFSEPLSFPV